MKSCMIYVVMIVAIHSTAFGLLEEVESPGALIEINTSPDFQLSKAQQRYVWLKRKQNQFALYSIGGLAVLFAYVPLDLLMQIFQYYCVQGDCSSGEMLIQRNDGENTYACCYELGTPEKCAQFAAKNTMGPDLKYEPGCAQGLSSSSINKVIPCNIPGIGLDDSCFKDVLFIPGSILVCGLVAEAVVGIGWLGFTIGANIHEWYLPSALGDSQADLYEISLPHDEENGSLIKNDSYCQRIWNSVKEYLPLFGQG